MNHITKLHTSSMGNERIERFWRDLGEGCVRRWRAFFYRLEFLHGLDPRRPHHLWILHTLFLNDINADLKAFQENWNRHRVSTAQMGNRTPLVRVVHFFVKTKTPSKGGLQDQRFLSRSTLGVRPNPSSNALKEIAELYYGKSVEDLNVNLDDLDDLLLQMNQAQDGSVRHEPVACDPVGSPFPSQDILQVFVDLHRHLVDENIVPVGYRLTEEELGAAGYPATQSFPVGRRGGREEEQELPVEVWYPMAVDWARALDSMNRTMEMYGVQP